MTLATDWRWANDVGMLQEADISIGNRKLVPFSSICLVIKLPLVDSLVYRIGSTPLIKYRRDSGMHRLRTESKGLPYTRRFGFSDSSPLRYPISVSVLAFVPIQRVLAIGTLDGRIKVIGGDNIEGLLISPKQFPFKYLEFLSNKGFLVSISNDNDIQVWSLENRYVGDDNGVMTVLKHEEDAELLKRLGHHFHIIRRLSEFFINLLLPGIGKIQVLLEEVLIAYESGLIILWDLLESHVAVVRGDKVFELKDGVIDSPGQNGRLSDGHNLEDKDITALCWASSNGTVVAVGYLDGDIMFWKTSTTASGKGRKAGVSINNVVRMQLSYAERKLPVIVLHWSPNSKSQNDYDGQLFVYGGDEIGSEEVLTLEWSAGMENLRCVGRAELTLSGSFADMRLLLITRNNHGADLLVLTSPGHLQLFSHDSLFSLTSEHDKRITLSSLDCPTVLPTLHLVLSATKLISLVGNENTSKFLLEIAANMKVNSTQKTARGNWPVSGGIVQQLSSPEGYLIEKIYVAGYVDGSVRIWDATSPVLSILCIIGAMKDVEVSGLTAPVSKLCFYSSTSGLAVGNQLGLVRVYNFSASSKETSLHIVTGTKKESQKQTQGEGPKCNACFQILDSPVQALQYVDNGAKLAVAYECGRVAVLDMNAFSVSFLTDSLPNPSSPVISMTWKSFVYNGGYVTSPKGARPKTRLRELMNFSRAQSTPSYSAGHSAPPSYNSGPSTPPSFSSGPSTPTNYSLRSSRNGECSNCKHLRGKITVLKATMKMHMHPEQHTVNSAALFHEVLNEMEKLDLE
ncbi:synaptobrevin, WD40/YVTN repeat-like-containing domain protein [Tanacetum coccineum]